MRESRKRTPARRTPPKRKQAEGVPSTEEYVRKLPRERLVEIVLEQVRENGLLARALQEEILERHGAASDLIEDIRELVQSTTDTKAKFDRRGFAEPVDYAPLYSAFKRLLNEKKYQELLQLGPLLARGSQYHMETSASDLEPQYTISEAIGCVVQALVKADWPNPDKIVYAVRLVVEDDYCACEKAEEFLNRRWAKRDWKRAAEMLRELTSEHPEAKDARERLDRWIGIAERKGQ
jgi:hypothetical protein